MLKTGIANLPLHHGKAPPWLFKRMVKLGSEITNIIITEYGTREFLKRISDPFFFQSFGCVLGFDWHSSGLTTTLTGALKQGINNSETGLFIAGGKGRTSKKTIDELHVAAEKFNLKTKREEEIKNTSRITAKVDNSLIQDNYQLYHHTLFVDEKGNWAVVQQGMNSKLRYARRYHWLSFETDDFVNEPHSKKNGIISSKIENSVMNLTSKQSSETRKTSLDLAKEKPERINRLFLKIFERQKTLFEYSKESIKELNMPRTHFIKNMNRKDSELLRKAIKKSYEIQPSDYEELIKIKGFGPKTIRSLALISQLIYGTEISWKDPARFSFAHGGKDGIPYPVNKGLMDKNTEFLKSIVEEAKLGNTEKEKMLKRLKEE